MSNYYLTSNGSFISDKELYHYGIPGMKWGIRKARTQVGVAKAARRSSGAMADMNNSRVSYKQAKAAYKQAKKAERNSPEAKAERAAKAKRAAKIGAAAAVTALAVYGGYKLNKYVKTKNCQIAAQRGYDQAQKVFEGMKKNMLDEVKRGNSTGFKLTSHAGASAVSSAKQASKDSFSTAAKNVINYKKSGGKLRTLSNIDHYRDYIPEELVVGKRR